MNATKLKSPLFIFALTTLFLISCADPEKKPEDKPRANELEGHWEEIYPKGGYYSLDVYQFDFAGNEVKVCIDRYTDFIAEEDTCSAFHWKEYAMGTFANGDTLRIHGVYTDSLYNEKGKRCHGFGKYEEVFLMGFSGDTLLLKHIDAYSAAIELQKLVRK